VPSLFFALQATRHIAAYSCRFVTVERPTQQ
jgi:hypothetical protein